MPKGQRRYVESLSAYARQFLERIEKPDVDLIDGLAPAIAIRQKNSTRNPRSTVATATEIYDYMRLLWARCGVVHCIVCNGIVKRDTVDEIASADSWRWARGRGSMRCFRCSRWRPRRRKPSADDGGDGKPGRKTRKAVAKAAEKPSGGLSDALRERLGDLRKRGFNRLYQNGAIYEFSTPESLLGDRLCVAGFCAGRSHRGFAGESGAHRRCGGDWVSGVGRNSLRECGRTGGRLAAKRIGDRGCGTAAFFGGVRVQELPSQSIASRSRACFRSTIRWGVPALPGIRQHDRLRSRPDHSGQIEDARRGGD